MHLRTENHSTLSKYAIDIHQFSSNSTLSSEDDTESDSFEDDNHSIKAPTCLQYQLILLNLPENCTKQERDNILKHSSAARTNTQTIFVLRCITEKKILLAMGNKSTTIEPSSQGTRFFTRLLQAEPRELLRDDFIYMALRELDNMDRFFYFDAVVESDEFSHFVDKHGQSFKEYHAIFEQVRSFLRLQSHTSDLCHQVVNQLQKYYVDHIIHYYNKTSGKKQENYQKLLHRNLKTINLLLRTVMYSAQTGDDGTLFAIITKVMHNPQRMLGYDTFNKLKRYLFGVHKQYSTKEASGTLNIKAPQLIQERDETIAKQKEHISELEGSINAENVRNLEDENRHLRTQLEATVAENKALRRKNSVTSLKYQNLANAHQEILKNNSELTTRVTQLLNRLCMVHQEKNSFENEVAKLREEAASRDEIIRFLTDKLEHVTAALSANGIDMPPTSPTRTSATLFAQAKNTSATAPASSDQEDIRYDNKPT